MSAVTLQMNNTGNYLERGKVTTMHKQMTRRVAPSMTLLATAVLLACASLAHASDGIADATPTAAAQDTTQATSQPQQAPQALPEPQMAAQASFVLQGVTFDGATSVPESELQAALADKIGTKVTFADLEQLATRVVAVYQQRGFGLVQAFVPVQEVVDGRVRITVSEGVLGNVNIELADGTPVEKARVAGTLAVLEPGKPLNGRQYERPARSGVATTWTCG